MKYLYKKLYCFSLIALFFSNINLLAQNFESASQIGGSGEDIAGEIKIDAQGNKYILGMFGGTAFTEMIDIDPTNGVLNCFTYGGQDIFLIKLSAQGGFLWGTTFGGISDDESYSLELDASGNAYVTGTYNGKFQVKNGQPLFNSLSNTNDAFVCKFDGSNGNLLNSISIGGTGHERGVDLDIGVSGDIYLTGEYGGKISLANGISIDQQSNSNFNKDIYMIKLDPSFNPLWGNGIGNNNANYVSGIEMGLNDELTIFFAYDGAIDIDPSQGGVVSIGGQNGSDIMLARYDQNGNYVSNFPFSSPGYDFYGDFIIDANNNILVTGRTGGIMPIGALGVTSLMANFFMAKLDYNYTAQLASVWEGSYFPAPSITTDQSDNIYITGLFQDTVDLNNDPLVINSLGAGNLPGTFVLKLDNNASFQWAKKLGETFYELQAFSAIDQDDVVHTIGSFQNTHDFDPGTGLFNMSSFQNTVDFFYQACNQNPPAPPGGPTKLYGDSLDHRAREIKHVDGDIYLASEVHKNGQVYGVFSRFDAQGNLIWEQEFDENTTIRDFAYDPQTEIFLLVGNVGFHEVNGMPNHNQSFIQSFDKNGNCDCQNVYDQTGREGFDRVIVHPDPKDKAFPFYALGTLNDPIITAPSSDNLVRLWNFDFRCRTKWTQEYAYAIDDEFHRGLVPLLNGNLLLLGNDSPANDGILVEVDGNTGSVSDAKRLTSTKIDLYDGVQVDAKTIILTGTDFSNNKAIVLSVDDQYNLKSGIQYDDLVDFRQIGKDQFDNIYATGTTNPSLKPRNHVCKIDVNSSGVLSKVWNKTIDSRTPIDLPYVYVDELRDHIYYADSRISNLSSGFGLNDVFFGVFDLELSSNCTENIGVAQKSFTCNIEPANVKFEPVSELTTQVFKCNSTQYMCTDPCGGSFQDSCQADFAWTAYCFNVDFSDMSISTGMINSWAWDIDCDGTTDYTSQNPSHIFSACGSYDVCLSITTQGGCASDTMMTVVIEDMSNPVISCQNVSVDVLGCARGRMVNFSASASDNCGIDTLFYSHQPGDFFPCGNTQVLVTAIDSCGNTSYCNINVHVNCTCAQIISSSISCTSVDTVFDFMYEIKDLSGSPFAVTCSILNSVNQPGVTLSSSSLTWTSLDIAKIIGTLTVTTPLPLSLTINNDFSCVCSDGNPISCSVPVNFTTPCCLNLPLIDQEICATDNTASISLVDCNDIDGATLVNWFVADGSCGQNPFTHIQTSSVCSPLILNPLYHSSSICVYADVSFDSSNPCEQVRTDTMQISLCNPPSCSIPLQEFCYTGQAILPNLLQVNIPASLANCELDIQWFENGVALLGEIQSTYQPSSINYTLGPNDCSEDNTTYHAEVSNACGTFTCPAVIRLYNDAAPMGNLAIDPFEPRPFCPGEDATIKFDPNCVGDPPRWTWSSRTVVDPLSLLNNGDRSPQFNTNKLYESTWYQVNAQNGVCPEDSIDLLIKVYPETSITSFTVDHQCDLNTVDLVLKFFPDQTTSGYLCDYTIDWYKDGILIHSDIYTTSAAVFSYSSTDKAGNYQAVLRNNCCPGQVLNSDIINVPPATQLFIAGPCFRCNDEDIDLEAIVISPQGTGCILEWRDKNNVFLSNNPTITISSDIRDFVTLSRLCNGDCDLVDTFYINQCGRYVSIDELLDIDLSVYPNPSTDQLFVELEETASEYLLLTLYSLDGKVIKTRGINTYERLLSLDISSYASGVYLLEIKNQEHKSLRKKIIKL